MRQLILLEWQPPPEVLTNCENLPPQPPVINQHAIAWQEGSIAYYRKLMLRFMELQRIDATTGTATPQKQAMRRHMISHLHELCEGCLDKIKQLGGE